MWVDYKPVDEDNTRIFHVLQMWIGMNEFDKGILETVVLRRWERSKQKFWFYQTS